MFRCADCYNKWTTLLGFSKTKKRDENYDDVLSPRRVKESGKYEGMQKSLDDINIFYRRSKPRQLSCEINNL